MSFSRLANRELKVGEKISLTPGKYNYMWEGVVMYIGYDTIQMVKPKHPGTIRPGETSFCSNLQAQYENIYWKRVGEKKNHLPNWL
jgi:hypothetical protein